MNGISLDIEEKKVQKLGDVEISDRYFNRFKTGFEEVDTLFGDGGPVPGQVITISAPRGSGKTTSLLQMLQCITMTNKDKKCVYVSGEEQVEQLSFTANRVNSKDVYAINLQEADEIADLTEEYDIMVVDSLASVKKTGIASETKAQNYFINLIYNSAHRNNCTVILILHMTKDGKAKGNSSIEHTVDTCIRIFNLEEETYGKGAKLFTTDKNRFGQLHEVIFRMGGHGFDFSTVVEKVVEKKEKPKSARQVQADRELVDLYALLDVYKAITYKDIWDLIPDRNVATYDRYKRRLQKLVVSGEVDKSGHGEKAVFTLKK